MIPYTPAGRLVTAFGNAEAMRNLYDENIEWSLPASLLWPRPIVGRDAVAAFNEKTWTESYFPDCSVTIQDEIGDERLSAVRFIYSARFRSSGLVYENEYTVFARSGPQGIVEVFESMDTLSLLDQFDGQKPGATFSRFSQERGAG